MAVILISTLVSIIIIVIVMYLTNSYSNWTCMMRDNGDYQVLGKNILNMSTPYPNSTLPQKFRNLIDCNWFNTNVIKYTIGNNTNILPPTFSIDSYGYTIPPASSSS
jgi:hypothetical protein